MFHFFSFFSFFHFLSLRRRHSPLSSCPLSSPPPNPSSQMRAEVYTSMLFAGFPFDSQVRKRSEELEEDEEKNSTSETSLSLSHSLSSSFPFFFLFPLLLPST